MVADVCKSHANRALKPSARALLMLWLECGSGVPDGVLSLGPGEPCTSVCGGGHGTEDGTGADGGAAPRDQSSPSCCHSGLPSPVTSYPKEPAEWPEMRADHDGGSRSRDQGGAAGGTGRSLSGSPSPSRIAPGKPQSFIPPAPVFPAPAPARSRGCPALFFCLLSVRVFAPLPSFLCPSSMNELTEPALEGDE